MDKTFLITNGVNKTKIKYGSHVDYINMLTIAANQKQRNDGAMNDTLKKYVYR